jgi:hypothetical protein
VEIVAAMQGKARGLLYRAKGGGIQLFITTCSDLWAMHQKKCKNAKMRFV